MIYLTSSSHNVIIAAQAQISANCSFPNNKGTESWAIVTQSVDQSIYFIMKPPAEGYNLGEFTQAQMLQNIDMIEIIEQEYNSAWFPIQNGD